MYKYTRKREVSFHSRVATDDVMEKSLRIKMTHRKCSQLSLIAVCVCVWQRDIVSLEISSYLFAISKDIKNDEKCKHTPTNKKKNSQPFQHGEMMSDLE